MDFDSKRVTKFVSQASEKSHVAGIVPLITQKFSHGFPWNELFTPVGNHYTVLEYSITQCAWAGCNTIWIICESHLRKLIRNRIGNYIYDPVELLHRTHARKRIPIFYVDIEKEDKIRKYSIPWSIIYASYQSISVSNSVSRWIAPDQFFVAFPYGLYDPAELQNFRQEIKSRKDIYLSHNNKNMLNEQIYLPFTFSAESLPEYKSTFFRKEKKLWESYSEQSKKWKKLPNISKCKERFTGKYLTLMDIFGEESYYSNKSSTGGIELIHLKWYYDISIWEQYCEFMGKYGSTFSIVPGTILPLYRQAEF